MRTKKNKIKNLIKISNLTVPRCLASTPYVKHTIKFATLYLPGSIKDIRLYFRRESCPNSFLDKDYRHKILIKQSYILLVWLHYLSQQATPGYQSNSQNLTSPEVESSTRVPKFFIYPKNNYKTTIQKAPMAHKTFSQEQYMIRYYVLSISFTIRVSGG